MSYNHSITLYPYGNNPERGIVGIDPENLHGHWEYRDGTEGGELTFSRDGDTLKLEDYDGAFSLPKPVIKSLKWHGIQVDEDFE